MPYTTPEELLARLHAVFPDGPWPVGKVAAPCSCDECRDLSEFLQGKRWTEITPDDAFSIHAGTSLYFDEAFAYVLPAFMKASLLDMEAADVVVDKTAWCFLPYSPSDKPNRTASLLSVAQTEVLCDWLEWYTLDLLEDASTIEPVDEEHAAYLRASVRNDEFRADRYRAIIAAMRPTA